MFVYKHIETIKYVKNWPIFWEKYKLYGRLTPEFCGLRMGNSQGIIFMWIRTNRKIFKFALVYL